MPNLDAVFTCPRCSAETVARMPEESCLFFWTCPHCAETIRPKPEDCCVFCSYSTTPCPPKQRNSNRDTDCSPCP